MLTPVTPSKRFGSYSLATGIEICVGIRPGACAPTSAHKYLVDLSACQEAGSSRSSRAGPRDRSAMVYRFVLHIRFGTNNVILIDQHVDERLPRVLGLDCVGSCCGGGSRCCSSCGPNRLRSLCKTLQPNSPAAPGVSSITVRRIVNQSTERLGCTTCGQPRPECRRR